MNCPNREIFAQIHIILKKLKQQIDELVNQGKSHLDTAQNSYTEKRTAWENEHSKIRDDLNQAIAKLPPQVGKSGVQLGSEYQDIIKQLADIDKHKANYKQQKGIIDALKTERRRLLEDYRQTAFDRFTAMNKAVKGLNRKLGNKLRINSRSKGNLEELEKFLENIDGVGKRKIEWLKEIESPDLAQWVDWIEAKDSNAFMNEYKASGITMGLANTLIGLILEKQLQLQEIELKDVVEIELNTSHIGSNTKFCIDGKTFYRAKMHGYLEFTSTKSRRPSYHRSTRR